MNTDERFSFMIVYLLRDIILSPRQVFDNIRNRKGLKEVCFVFILGAILTFLKTFLLKKETVPLTFFADQKITKLLTFMSIPQVTWIVGYATYFLFIFCVFALCKLFNNEAHLKSLTLSLMATSGLGIIMQILFYILKFILPDQFVFILTHLVYLWAIVLSIFAIKASQSISISKSLFCFLIPALFFIPFTVGLAAVTPYLSWVNF